MSKDELKTKKTIKKDDNSPAKSEKKSDKKADSKSVSKDKKKQPGKVKKYFKDLKSEFKKVVWPSKKQVINNSSVVLATVILIGVFVGLFDTGLGFLLKLILNK
ncbi:MAG: preprotein translocase subunit SecE [Oscillospiraceae bacterium]|nr:preprotein translocase subunit SecE [Oscillospiraceae bacterium]